MALLTLCLGTGCIARDPSLALKALDSRTTEEWLARQKEMFSEVDFAEPVEGVESTVVSASLVGETLVWLEQGSTQTVLWSAPVSRLQDKSRVFTGKVGERIFHCSLNPEATRILLLVETRGLTPLQQARLEVLEVESGRTHTVSMKASSDFKPRWCNETIFLYAEIDSNTIRVLKQTGTALPEPILSHSSDYPRLQLHQLSPQGWLILDRNRRRSFHGWITRTDQADSGWLELTAEQRWARPLGWDEDQMIFVVREATNLSRFVRVPVGDSPRQSLDLVGSIVARVDSVEQAFLSGSCVFFVSFEAWNHSLFKLDIRSGELSRLSWGVEPAQAHAFEPTGDGRALVRLEGPLQPPSVFEVTDKAPWVRPLIRPDPVLSQDKLEVRQGKNLEMSPGQVAPDSPVLLEAYGGFQESIRPYYDPVRALWLKKGGKIVIAGFVAEPKRHQNVVRSIVELAAELRPSPVAYRGSSFGGTLGLAAMFYDPTAFDAVWVDAPLTDLLSFDEFYPGRTWVAELGDPSDSAEAERLKSYSPLHLVQSTAYPPLLVTTALDDPVVHPSHSLRLVDTIQRKNPAGKAFLMTQTRGSHHRPPGTLEESLKRAELLWSWARKR